MNIYKILVWILILITIACADEIHDMIMCLGKDEEFTITCQGDKLIPPFINLEELTADSLLVYMPGMNANACPTNASAVSKGCEREASTPSIRCHTLNSCHFYPKDIDRPLYDCPLSGAANVLIFKYKCTNQVPPRDIILFSSYVEGDVIPYQEGNIFSPGFPNTLSNEAQTFSCTFKKKEITALGRYSVKLLIKHLELIGDRQYQSLQIFVDNSKEPKAEYEYNMTLADKRANTVEFIRFETQCVVKFNKYNKEYGGKMWISFESETDLDLECRLEVLTGKEVTSEMVNDIPPVKLTSAVTTTEGNVESQEVNEPDDEQSIEPVKENNDDSLILPMSALIIIGVILVMLLVAVIVIVILCFLIRKRRKQRKPTTAHPPHLNMYSEVQPNRKLVYSEVFNTQLSDSNANVIPLTINNDINRLRISGNSSLHVPMKPLHNRSNPHRNIIRNDGDSYDRVNFKKPRWRSQNNYVENNDYAHFNDGFILDVIPKNDRSSHYDNVTVFCTDPDKIQKVTIKDPQMANESTPESPDENPYDFLSNDYTPISRDNRSNDKHNETYPDVDGRNSNVLRYKQDEWSNPLTSSETMMFDNTLYQSLESSAA